jgi:hypothetical protein
MSDLICYCFNYTASDIRDDVAANGGQSLILERITTEKAGGNCRCETNHPEGR